MHTYEEALTSLDINQLDRRALALSAQAVRAAAAEDFSRTTPCEGWTLADLLAHMTAQHVGFAAAARGHGADPDVWRVREQSDPVDAYLHAADGVLAAFAATRGTDQRFALPEILPGYPFPAEQAISFHFLDYVVHGWDVARSLGRAYAPESEVLDAALAVAQQVPDGEARTAPGAAFAPQRIPTAGAGRLEQLLTVLGRSPSWPM